MLLFVLLLWTVNKYILLTNKYQANRMQIRAPIWLSRGCPQLFRGLILHSTPAKSPNSKAPTFSWNVRPTWQWVISTYLAVGHINFSVPSLPRDAPYPLPLLHLPGQAVHSGAGGRSGRPRAGAERWQPPPAGQRKGGVRRRGKGRRSTAHSPCRFHPWAGRWWASGSRRWDRGCLSLVCSRRWRSRGGDDNGAGGIE